MNHRRRATSREVHDDEIETALAPLSRLCGTAPSPVALPKSTSDVASLERISAAIEEELRRARAAALPRDPTVISPVPALVAAAPRPEARGRRVGLLAGFALVAVALLASPTVWALLLSAGTSRASAAAPPPAAGSASTAALLPAASPAAPSACVEPPAPEPPPSASAPAAPAAPPAARTPLKPVRAGAASPGIAGASPPGPAPDAASTPPHTGPLLTED